MDDEEKYENENAHDNEEENNQENSDLIEEDNADKAMDDSASDTSEEFEEFLKEYNNPENEDPFGVIEDKNIPNGEETHRLSVMNIDWENISAKDLYVLFNSFISGKEKVLRVDIYPSEFGINEMEKIKSQGPNELFANEQSDEQEDKDTNKNNNPRNKKGEKITNLDQALADDDDSENAIDQAKLRKFELKKLKFYYAIVSFDSKTTANKVYQMYDGMEIEKTQNFLDLRFVPDELSEFPHPPKESFVGNKSLISYEPEFHQNRALQHSKVKLTWDTNDKKRDKMIERAFTKQGFNRDDINELLVSSDSEEDEELVGFRQTLLKNAENESKDNMQLLKRKKNKELNIKEGETFEVNFNKGFEGVNVSDKVTNSSKNDRSNYNEYLERKKNIRREKKIEEKKQKEFKKQRRDGNYEENNEYRSNKEENKKDKYEKSNKKELSLLVDESLKDKKFKYNSKDERFLAVGKDTKFAIDPTSKEYKNIKNNKN